MSAKRAASGVTAALLLLAGATGAAAAPQTSAPTLPLLMGAGEAETRIRLGAPDIARREAKGAMWTYRRPGCALFIYFRAEPELRVVGASAAPRRRGEPAPATDACLLEVAAQKR